MIKIKLFFVLTLLVLAASCSKTSTNPIQSPSKEDLKDYGKPIIPPVADDGSVEYEGNAQLVITTLDGITLTKPESIKVYVDIFDDNTAIVHSPNTFEFKDIKMDNKINEYITENDDGIYTLKMKLESKNSSYITDFTFIILSKRENYKFYITADKLNKIIK